MYSLRNRFLYISYYIKEIIKFTIVSNVDEYVLFLQSRFWNN